MSESCLDQEGASHANWPGRENTQVVELPIVDSVNPRPPFLPPALPADLVDRIERLHGDPIVWWVSQFLLYMLRPQPHLQSMLDMDCSPYLPFLLCSLVTPMCTDQVTL